MPTKLIGRIKEIRLLEEALNSDEAEMISVIGRRRVGKTFLIQQAYKSHIVFEISGIQNLEKRGQIRNFTERLTEFFPKKDIQVPKDWLDAFFLLVRLLRKKEKRTSVSVN